MDTSAIGSGQIPGVNQNPTPNKTMGQQDFLRLLVAQVQHQDPLEPQTNGDFLAQMAQFSTNDAINSMQKSLESLAASLQSNQALQGSALVGRKVLINSDQLQLGAEGEVKAAIDMPAGVNNLTASIFSESGELIKTIPLGQPQPGMFDFSWDGTDQSNNRMPAGKYSIKVTGRYADKEVALKTMTTASVDSVSMGQYGEGMRLNLSNGMGSVTLEDVRQIAV